MFSTLNSMPMSFRPRSDVNRFRAIQNELNKRAAAGEPVNKPKETANQLQPTNPVNRIAPSAEKKDKPKPETLTKVTLDPHPEPSEKPEKPKPKEENSNEKLISIIDQKFKQYIDTIAADNKNRRNDEPQKKLNKNYEELKSFVEQKLSVIDDLANFIRKQKTDNELAKKLINVDENKIIHEENTDTLVEGNSKPVVTSKKQKPKNTAKPVPSRIRAAANDEPATDPEPKPDLLSKKRKRTFFEITDEKWTNIRSEFPDLKEEDKTRVFSDGVNNYIEVKGKKIPLDYKAILKLNKENKKNNTKKPEKVTVKPPEPKKDQPKAPANPKVEDKRKEEHEDDDEELEREIDQQLRDEDEFKQHKQQSKDERLAYLNQLKKEKREMIKRQKLAERSIESDEEGIY